MAQLCGSDLAGGAGEAFVKLQSGGRWGWSHLEGSLTHESRRGRPRRLRTGTAGTSTASLSLSLCGLPAQ